MDWFLDLVVWYVILFFNMSSTALKKIEEIKIKILEVDQNMPLKVSTFRGGFVSLIKSQASGLLVLLAADFAGHR